MNQNLSDMLPEILVDVPGCPEHLALVHLRKACREFFRKSRAWRKSLDRIPIVNNVAVYPLDAPIDAEVIGVRSVKHNDRKPLDETDPIEEDSKNLDWRFEVGSPLKSYHMDDPNTLRVVPIPSGFIEFTDYLYVIAELIPTNIATTLESTVMNRYWDSLIDGALYKLFELTKEPWADPAMATKKEIKFRARISEARIEASKGFTRKDVRVQMRPLV